MGKGVFCRIEKAENMPVDEAGNRADVVMDGNSTINRMNIGRIYETYISATQRDVRKQIIDLITQHVPIEKNVHKAVDYYYNHFTPEFNKIYEMLLRYYQILSPKQYEFFRNVSRTEDKINHVSDCIESGIYLYLPTDNQVSYYDAVKQLEAEFKPTYGKVTYVGLNGQKVVTEDKIRISPLYMMLLEKIGDDWASVSSGALQHFGILSPITKGQKFELPFRNSPVRTIGETEGRIYVSYLGREAAAEMMDRNNNPITHKQVVKSILQADKPTNIDVAVDRRIIPLGNTKPLQILKHITLCAGWRLKYEPETNRSVITNSTSVTS